MNLEPYYTRKRDALRSWYECLIDGQAFPFDEGNEAAAHDAVRRHVAGICDEQDIESGPRPELSLAMRRDIYKKMQGN